MKYTNANIKSKKELAQRLIDGEEFYLPDGGRVHFNETFHIPFMVDENSMRSDVWNMFAVLHKQAAWYENIEKPVICWCWDGIGDDKVIDAIIAYNQNAKTCKFDSGKNCYKNAEPVKPEELLQNC